jgi:hypothetical protein
MIAWHYSSNVAYLPSKRGLIYVIVKEVDVEMMCSCPDSKDVRQAGLYILSHLASYT